MKTHKQILLFCSCFLLACQSKNESITVLSVNNAPLVVCDESKVNDEKETKLSELVDSLQIIRLDNRDEAFFKYQWIALSEHYVCIWQRDGGAVKLFDKSGRYLCDIGAVGQGPGEYRFIYDALIDEAQGRIYLSSYIGESVLTYTLQGEFLEKIDFGETLNKPRLFLNPDATFSLVHLCFNDRHNKFVAANVPTSQTDSIQYVYIEELVTSFKDPEGKKTGLNQEVWSYRNVDNFPFMLTSTDTLYHYNSMTNEVKASFTMQMAPEKKGDAFFIFNELPRHYLVFVVGENGETILIDKESREASRVKFINNRMGNMEIVPHFQDGYFFDIYEPIVLKEKLEKQIESDNCPEEQKEDLKTFLSTLNENDNNILMLGKLKH